MSVRAPHSSNLLTASVSVAMTAKKRTGKGILDTLGSAPRSSNSFRVFKRTRCLVRREHNTSNRHRNTQTKSVSSGQNNQQRTIEDRTDSVFMAAILRTVSCVSED